MLDAQLLDIARLLFQAGGGVAWVLLYLLLLRMLAIVEKVVDRNGHEHEEREKGSVSVGAEKVEVAE
ncbi:MAG: hypothetical protein AMXMBFR44_6850 [Candidatus Campbellbacteria bacterium]